MSAPRGRPAARSSAANAVLVALGILASRLIGFLRERVFAHYFGNSAAADAFKAALRIPNFLQNLFGEGALSASFIPVYARLLARGDEAEARRVARAVGTLLCLLVSTLVLIGVAATPLLIGLIAPGFTGEKREATIRLVRILFPGVGLLVLSAWCLGILNSHRRFFLPYAAPVLWNGALIAALVALGGKLALYPLAEALAWASVAGSALQLAVQLPVVVRLAGRLRFELDTRSAGLRTVVRNFLPSVGSRGVNQISSYVDSILGSFLPTGAVAALAYAQTLYLVPASLFGMSMASAELPEMASQSGSAEEVGAALRERLAVAMRRVAFFVVPSVCAFLALGDVVVALLFQTGRFTRDDVVYVWAVVAGASVGLLAGTLGRLYASAFWALHDTRTPLLFAVARVALGTALGTSLAFGAPPLLGLAPRWGLVGITLASGMASWVEFALLRRALSRRIGRVSLTLPALARFWGVALASAAAGVAVKLALAGRGPVLVGLLVLAVYGSAYLALSFLTGQPEARALARRLPFSAA